MEVHIASPLIPLSMYDMATSMCRCVTDASTRTRSNREAGFSSINSLGMNPSVPIAGRRTTCSAPTVIGLSDWRDRGPYLGLLLTVPSWRDNKRG